MAHIDINFISAVLGRAVDVTLILPSKTAPTLDDGMGVKSTYYQKKRNKKYPLLILLHGYLNDCKTWCAYTRCELYAEENNIAVAMISGENKFYLNAEAKHTKDDFYDFIEYELKDFLYGNFPISSKRKDNFIAGLSMGGFGALYHALTNPKAYAAVGAFSPGVGIGEDIPLRKNRKYPEIYIAIGDQDFLLENNVRFDEELNEKNISHTFEIVEGYAHEWRFWDLELEKFMKNLNRTDSYVDETPRGV